MRTVSITRYLTPLCEGDSVPALVECDHCGTYVLELRCAAQGGKALVAGSIAGDIYDPHCRRHRLLSDCS